MQHDFCIFVVEILKTLFHFHILGGLRSKKFGGPPALCIEPWELLVNSVVTEGGGQTVPKPTFQIYVKISGIHCNKATLYFLSPLLRIWQIKAFTDSAPGGKKSHLDIFSKSRQGPWIHRGEISSTMFQFQCTGSSSNPLPLDRLLLPANLPPPQAYLSPKKMY